MHNKSHPYDYYITKRFQEGPEYDPSKEGLTRRDLIVRTLKAGAVSLIPLAFGVRSCVKEVKEKNRLEEEIARRGYKLDHVTGNYLDPNSKVWMQVQQLDKNETSKRVREVMDAEGNVMKDVKGHPVMLREYAALALEKADKMMFEATQKHIKVRRHLRSNYDQYKINGSGTISAEFGYSFHEAGLAIDVQNWTKAQKFLVASGLIGGLYTKSNKWVKINGKRVLKKFRNIDANHFSFGNELQQDLVPVLDVERDWTPEMSIDYAYRLFDNIASETVETFGGVVKEKIIVERFCEFVRENPGNESLKDASTFLKVIGKICQSI